MTAVDVEVDISTLEALDFPIPCEHSQHRNPMSHHAHGGDAEYIVRALHMCPGETSVIDYAACAKWAAYVNGKQGQDWMCAHCKWVGPGEEMCIVVGKLHEGS